MGTVSIYAVFDGHGIWGHDVSDFVKDVLPQLLVIDPRFWTVEHPALLRDAFCKMQQLIPVWNKDKALFSGSTATVCLHDHPRNTLTIAHIADSTAVLSQSGGRAGGNASVAAITRNHRPELDQERARI